MLAVMTYTARTRDRYRLALAALTGVTTVGALTACGWLAGTAAHDHEASLGTKEAARQQAQRRALFEWQQQRAAWRAAHADRPRVRTVWRKRPERTVVDTRVVRVGSVGTGGTLSTSGGTSGGSSGSSTYAGSSTAGGPSGASSGGSSGGSSAGSSVSHQSAAPPPPPPPKPAPAPSSGS